MRGQCNLSRPQLSLMMGRWVEGLWEVVVGEAGVWWERSDVHFTGATLPRPTPPDPVISCQAISHITSHYTTPPSPTPPNLTPCYTIPCPPSPSTAHPSPLRLT